jgi:hypothetical protein
LLDDVQVVELRTPSCPSADKRLGRGTYT